MSERRPKVILSGEQGACDKKDPGEESKAVQSERAWDISEFVGLKRSRVSHERLAFGLCRGGD